MKFRDDLSDDLQRNIKVWLYLKIIRLDSWTAFKPQCENIHKVQFQYIILVPGRPVLNLVSLWGMSVRGRNLSGASDTMII